MTDRRAPTSLDDDEDGNLWFMPAPPDDAAWEIPGPRAPRHRLEKPQDWQAAEAALARPLADAASLLARLDERLRGTPGLVRRLALEQAARLSWLDGPGLSADRLVLHDVLRVSMVADGHRDLATARWAFRRLGGGPGPLSGGAGGLLAFLGRHAADTEAEGLAEFSERPSGESFTALADRWTAALDDGLHPITRAGLARALWDRLGLSGGSAIEAAVVAARIGAEGCHVLPYLPLGPRLGPSFAEPSGVTARLGVWYEAVSAGARSGLAQVDRIADWRARAESAVAAARLKGRTPPLLITAIAESPALSVPMAASLTGASMAAVLRNLDWFAAQGLTREITGQGRFRFWTLA